MNSKERVKQALRHKESDRVPRYIWYGKGIQNKLKEKIGCSGLDLEIALGNDILQTWLSINYQLEREAKEGQVFTDEWGITWKREGYYNMLINHPLENSSSREFINYTLPDPYDSERYTYLNRLINYYGNKYFIGADVSGTIFAPTCHLRGMEQLLVDLISEEKRIEILLNRMANFSLQVALQSLKLGVDWIWLGDDFGTQQGMLLSPKLWRKYFKPRMARIISKIKHIKPDIFIAYHSCGSIWPIIPDLVEIGIDALNPIQSTAKDMDAKEIKTQFGDEITLICGVDTQDFLQRATPEMVKFKVRKIIDVLGPGGGFIFAVSHTIQTDVSIENVLAMVEALNEI